jgi:(1->4)-alpha-D-glucan 1-alpha-D-glucosylmutase
MTMLTLSTHDTKRSADVRARINVLSELSGDWADAASRWAEMASKFRRDGLPDRNAEYLLYQTIVGAWPLEATRAVSFMLKAAREAKVHTSWIDPNHDYETALEGFVRSLLADPPFVEDLQRFLAARLIVQRGRQNSLAQMALLLTHPGVPDLYQGSELWDLSLVDPDNRRPVDYATRSALLAELRSGSISPDDVQMESGAAKLSMVHRLLEHRCNSPDPFRSADYEALPTGGPSADAVLAFRRRDLAVVVPVRTTRAWDGTTVDLPAGAWRDVLTGHASLGGRLDVRDLWVHFPVGVLAREGG